MVRIYWTLQSGGVAWELDSLMEIHLHNGIPPCILGMIDNGLSLFEHNSSLSPARLWDSLCHTLQQKSPGLALADQNANSWWKN
ncbi:MAG: hypothetical protein FJ343_04350 [Sphingomonadales bacterium]|nr:hypothetical protein [Sphingomonadales bacterium]